MNYGIISIGMGVALGTSGDLAQRDRKNELIGGAA
jgi:hypothetical protein